MIWSESLLEESKAQLDGWYRIKTQCLNVLNAEQDKRKIIELSWYLNDLNLASFWSHLSDLGVLLGVHFHSADYEISLGGKELDGVVDVSLDRSQLVDKSRRFLGGLNSLGLLQKDPEEWFRGGLDYDALVEEYDSVRAQALAAKEAGDKATMGEMFKRSDEIRDQFKAEGVVIESGAGGKSSWRKA